MSYIINIKAASPGVIFLTNNDGVERPYAQGTLYPVIEYDGSTYYCTLQVGKNDLSPALNRNPIGSIVCQREGSTQSTANYTLFKTYLATYCFYTPPVTIVNGRTGSPYTLSVGAHTTNESLPVAIATDQVAIPVKSSYARFAATSTLVTPYVYTAGQLMGGMLTFTQALPALTGRLKSITITDIHDVNAVLAIVLYRLAPVSTTYTDAAAYVIHVNDRDKVLGCLVSNVIPSIGGVVTIPTDIDLVSTEGDLFAHIVMKSNGTYADDNALTVELGIQY